jgi:bifunctional enzyme CysN/CysC
MSATQDQRPLPIVVVGHVDHGKSTLIGRMLHDAGALPSGKVEELTRVSARRGMPIEWSFALDALQLERDQAITVDSTQTWFRTAARTYVIVDAPGHQEFLRNMITGAAQAEAAILVVDAAAGLTEHAKRHAYLLHLLGVDRVVLALNKMDTVGFDRAVFDGLTAEIAAYVRDLGVVIAASVPVSARHGDNLVTRSERCPWWTGPTVVNALDSIARRPAPTARPFRLAVQDVYRRDQRRVIVGRIESGAMKVGDEVAFWPGDRRARIKTFESWGSSVATVAASAPQSVAFTIDRDLFVERGQVVAAPAAPPRTEKTLRVRLFWLGKGALTAGRTLRLALGTATVEAVVGQIHHIVDIVSSQPVAATQIAPNGIGEATLKVESPIVWDATPGTALGRAVLIDGCDVVGGCTVVDAVADSHAVPARATEPVRDVERWARHRHRGGVFWLTGLSGAGKTTLARAAERALFEQGRQVVVLDGDGVRGGLSSDLGFTDADRAENIRRGAEVARLMAANGLIVLAAFISPLESHRQLARRIVGADFHDVHLTADLETCERRDIKGLYRRARRGEIGDFTGVSGPWEPPRQPDLVIPTGVQPLAESVRALLAYVDRRVVVELAAA